MALPLGWDNLSFPCAPPRSGFPPAPCVGIEKASRLLLQAELRPCMGDAIAFQYEASPDGKTEQPSASVSAQGVLRLQFTQPLGDDKREGSTGCLLIFLSNKRIVPISSSATCPAGLCGETSDVRPLGPFFSKVQTTPHPMVRRRFVHFVAGGLAGLTSSRSQPLRGTERGAGTNFQFDPDLGSVPGKSICRDGGSTARKKKKA
ncbi:hypothetical protein N658DRAFT_327179 [Parathielavia hyrcaniae]|uniref:Uncharacterized protein n=1 Tax=Parathielavia hyrcaniae TaxID=113614 RepID=A0AAN6Q3E8_9PEZI|nr:hypothetical protein N658DRAFT_327179 [Parathielavia hyrcaniae]